MNRYTCLLYIDPGTGAMLLTTILGLVTTCGFVSKKLFFRMKFLLSGGKDKNYKTVDKKHDIVIFSDHRRYWNVFKPICDELEKRNIECEFWTASEDDPALEEDYSYVKCSYLGKGNRAYAKLNSMRATICLATTPGIDVYQWKRSPKTDYYIHIPHDIGGVVSYHMFGVDYYDSILLSGRAMEPEIRELEKMRGLSEKEVQVVGSTYMDSLDEKHKVHLYDEKKRDDGRTTVLVAPTWGKISLLNRFGERLLNALSQTNYKIIVRPHPQSLTSEGELLKHLQNRFPDNDNWKWDFEDDNYNALSQSDIMISDYSGVILDYAFVFGKPSFFSTYGIDHGQCDTCWFDHPIFRDELFAHVGHELKEEDIDRIGSMIDELLHNEESLNEIDTMKNRCWEYRGESAIRVVDYIASKLEKIS